MFFSYNNKNTKKVNKNDFFFVFVIILKENTIFLPFINYAQILY